MEIGSLRGVKKKATIVNVRYSNRRVLLTLHLDEPRMPRAEQVIEVIPKTETEEVIRESTKVMFDEMKRRGMPIPSLSKAVHPPLVIDFSITEEEFESLGKPTVTDKVTLQIQVSD